MNLSFNASRSSLKMIELLVRFPYTKVNVLAGSETNVVLIMERMGVMPLPAAKAT